MLCPRVPCIVLTMAVGSRLGEVSPLESESTQHGQRRTGKRWGVFQLILCF